MANGIFDSNVAGTPAVSAAGTRPFQKSLPGDPVHVPHGSADGIDATSETATAVSASSGTGIGVIAVSGNAIGLYAACGLPRPVVISFPGDPDPPIVIPTPNPDPTLPALSPSQTAIYAEGDGSSAGVIASAAMSTSGSSQIWG